jgi:predicted 3-demethylubiquinone-9 3-methyltransferase (glyoxalase superfamily)
LERHSDQIVPQVFFDMMMDEDPQKSKRVMEAMMQLVKLDVARLEAAYEGNA